MQRTIQITCFIGIVLLLAIAATAQVIEAKKSEAIQQSTQSQFSYQKMIQSHTLTQQMEQNQYSYQKKTQNKTSNRKMNQGSNGNGNGGQGSGSGSNRNGNG